MELSPDIDLCALFWAGASTAALWPTRNQVVADSNFLYVLEIKDVPAALWPTRNQVMVDSNFQYVLEIKDVPKFKDARTYI